WPERICNAATRTTVISSVLSCRAGKQRVEPALALQRVQVVAAADMGFADEDLRKGRAAVGARDHLLPQFRRPGGAALGIGDRLALDEPLGGRAIAAQRAGIDRHFRHGAPGSGLPLLLI